ncbi:MAG: hypothetical protein RLZZ437_117 [Pseudomonadota bacterium]|jgi:Flp pilus assembly protein TadG
MPSQLPRIAQTAFARFAKAEDGNVATFSVLLFSLMVMIGGFAVDLMRSEHTRTSLQQTLDRCTLASAALRQSLNPEQVCRDYVQKSGLGPYLTSVNVVQGTNARTVQALATGQQDNIFAPLLGFETFTVAARSAATQSISDIEIVLVLDVSGSMSGTKIDNLKDAAADFIDTVTANNTDQRVSVSIVPYNAQVNLPDYLVAKYNATGPVTAANANCLEIPASMFAVPGISRTAPIPRAIFADPANGTTGGNSYTSRATRGNAGGVNEFQFCNPRNGDAETGPLTQNLVLPASSDATVLKARINALYAGGNTSITLGMKWGLAMIDPGTRSVYNELIGEGHIPSAFNGRPYDYNSPNKMKFIVLMTDGEHVAHRTTAPAYRSTTQDSPVWRGTDGEYSIRHTTGRPESAGTNEYWVPHLNDWRATPWTGAADDSGLAVQQSWIELWQSQRMSWVAWQLYARALGTDYDTRYTAFIAAMEDFTDVYASVTNMDNSLQQSCNLARANNVIVYGIAFEAPANGQTQIRNCATTPANYYEANGLAINTVFNTIASQITQLRLSQ